MKTNTITQQQKNISVILQLSVFSKFLLPFGNLILPLVVWLANKDKSDFIDRNGKEVLNFQLSLLLYTFIFILLLIPVALFTAFNFVEFINFAEEAERNMTINFADFGGFGVSLIILAFLALMAILVVTFEFILIIIGAIKAGNGEVYHYPLKIKFIA